MPTTCGRCSMPAIRPPAAGSVGASATGRPGGSDATFSAPKSVSVLWALSPDPWVRAEVLAAHDAAVIAALAWSERQGGVTRRGRDGVFQVDSRGVAVLQAADPRRG